MSVKTAVHACAAGAALFFLASIPVHADDPVSRMETFLRARKVDGITPDLRVTQWPTEQIRLTVIPQSLGYHELYRQTGRADYLKESTDRMDYLVRNFEGALRHRAHDGMLAYALYQAYQDTRNSTYLDHAEQITNFIVDLPLGPLNRLNLSLMGAMGLAKGYQVNPRPALLTKLREILDLLEKDQNPDGSFAHAYDGTDVHYSGWIAMELVLIRDSLPAGALPQIDRVLPRLGAFIAARVAPTGEPSYEEQVCYSERGACHTVYYYAKMTASSPEYDTRGWTNELGYEIFSLNGAGLLDKAESVRKFLLTLENSGAYPDKWAYPMDPVTEPDQDPISHDPQSVMRTSLLFWTMAATQKAGIR